MAVAEGQSSDIVLPDHFRFPPSLRNIIPELIILLSLARSYCFISFGLSGLFLLFLFILFLLKLFFESIFSLLFGWKGSVENWISPPLPPPPLFRSVVLIRIEGSVDNTCFMRLCANEM